MISTMTIHALATPAATGVTVMDGRPGTVASCAGGITRIQTATTVIRWIFSKGG